MSYTCTAGLITITDEANVTCQSICDACAQMTKQGTLQFISTAKWRFVNSHFKDTNKQMHFNVSSGYIYVDTNSSFQLGDKDGNGNVYNGCALIFNSCQTSFWSSGGASGTIKLYDSFLSLSGAFFRCYSGASQIFEMISCIVQKGSGGRIQGAASILKNLYLHDFTNYAYGGKGAGVTFDNIFISRSAYAMYYSPSSGGYADCTVKGLTGRNNTTGFRLTSGSPGDLYMVNPDIDVWSFTWNSFPGKVYRQYTFNLKVLDGDNNAIETASVILKDKDNNEIFSLSTNASGEIVEQTVSYGYYNLVNNTTIQSYSPHTLEIRKAGYKTYKKKFTLDSKADWTIALQKVLDNNFSKRVNFNNY